MNTRLLRWPVLTSIVSVAAILVITVGLVFDARRQIEAHTRDTSWNLLRAIGRDVNRNIEVLNLSLGGVIDGLQRPDVMALPPEIRNQVLFDSSATATGVGALMVFDEQGVLRIQSTSPEPHWIQPVGDRDYFQAQREADAGLFISRPYLSRLIDKEVVGLSRRRSNPNGSFGGVALATIQLAYFEELFTSLHLAPGAVLTLVRTDGAVLLRMEPGGFRRTGDFGASPVFQAIRQRGSGDYVGSSVIDGVERYFSFTRVGDLPLILTIGIPTASMYGDWAQKGALVVLVLAVISAVLVFLSIRLSDTQGRLLDANRELERLSTTDALTGLGNRRLFDDMLVREARRAARTHKPSSLILLDVDSFKLFNDRYGHPAGDQALRTLASILRERTRRPGDMAFRIGGEEFAVLLGEMSAAEAVSVMTAIQRHLQGHAIPHDGSPTGKLTVSQGAALISEDAAQPAIERADAALYRAKRDGRDRAYTEALSAAA